eukprot:2197444-Rhodomonas_salina.1
MSLHDSQPAVAGEATRNLPETVAAIQVPINSSGEVEWDEMSGTMSITSSGQGAWDQNLRAISDLQILVDSEDNEGVPNARRPLTPHAFEASMEHANTGPAGVFGPPGQDLASLPP